jgi:SAM-dependent methyltransferase
MNYSEDIEVTALFFDRAIIELAQVGKTPQTRVLDFGCGSGELVQRLVQLGYDAYGCDISFAHEASTVKLDLQRCKQIQQGPYRLPFDDEHFEVVLSSSVLEHARNPHEYLPEIRRVLKLGGCAMHLFPGKWYLPSEPHIHVPLMNWFYPRCPRWWFAFWTLLGQRSRYHRGLGWRETTEAYRKFQESSVFYLSARQHERLSRSVFESYEWPMEFYITHAQGGFARLCRKLPLRKLWGVVSREVRMAFLVQRKQQPPKSISAKRCG